MDNQIKFREFAVKFFDGKEVRTVWRDGEWWYATADALGAFTDSADPAAYWRTLKRRFKKEGVQPVTVCHGLKMPAKDGKSRQVDASNEQMLLRIVQSMPLPESSIFGNGCLRWERSVFVRSATGTHHRTCY